MSPEQPLQQSKAAGWDSQGPEEESSSDAQTQTGAAWVGGVLTVLVRGGHQPKVTVLRHHPKCQQF